MNDFAPGDFLADFQGASSVNLDYQHVGRSPGPARLRRQRRRRYEAPVVRRPAREPRLAYEGGTLRFPEYGQHLYKPEFRAAVVFSCSLLREAMPVTRGRRYVLLPFHYDGRMAVLRDRNRRFLGAGPLTPIEPLRIGGNEISQGEIAVS